MTRVVVDASVILASLMADGSTRGVLLGRHDLDLYAPEVIGAELQKHLAKVVDRVGKPREIVEALLGEVMGNLEVVATPLLAKALPSARSRTRAARAHHDEAYVALADTLAAPIWSLDRDFRRVRGVAVLTTAEVKQLAGPETRD